MSLLRRIWRAVWRRERPDDRWWEDGRPVEVFARPMGPFTLAVARQIAATEFDLVVDFNTQVFGSACTTGREIVGLSTFL